MNPGNNPSKIFLKKYFKKSRKYVQNNENSEAKFSCES